MKAKKWIFTTLALAVSIALLISLISFAVDPLLYFRKNNKLTYFYSERFSAAGMIKNESFDSVIIGSSMVQNYDLQYVRTKLDLDPIKLSMGAITPQEILMLYKKVQSCADVKCFIINIDLNRFNVNGSLQPDFGRFPEYLFNDSFLDDYKYLLGYENLTRFLPATAAVTLLKTAGLTIPASLAKQTDPDRIGEWYSERTFSTEQVVKSILSNAENFKGENDTTERTDGLEEGAKRFVEILRSELAEDQEIVFVLPPRSIAVWAGLNESQRDVMHSLREYIYDACREDGRFRMVDMTAAQVITQLDHYSDASHFDLSVQNKIVDAVSDGSYDLNAEKLKLNRDRIEYLAQAFDLSDYY